MRWRSKNKQMQQGVVAKSQLFSEAHRDVLCVCSHQGLELLPGLFYLAYYLPGIILAYYDLVSHSWLPSAKCSSRCAPIPWTWECFLQPPQIFSVFSPIKCCLQYYYLNFGGENTAFFFLDGWNEMAKHPWALMTRRVAPVGDAITWCQAWWWPPEMTTTCLWLSLFCRKAPIQQSQPWQLQPVPRSRIWAPGPTRRAGTAAIACLQPYPALAPA